ncbi:MAG: DNA topoisomerase, partial [Candidatus Paceibacteria bacterium]
VALRLVVEREQEIEQFEAQEYWTIQGMFDATDKTYPLQSQLSHINGKKLQKFAYTTEEDVNALLYVLRERSYEVTNVEKK